MTNTDEGSGPTRTQTRRSFGAGAVVVKNESVLLVRNRYGVTKGRYLLPAGRMEADELPDRTAEREILEETGLHVEVTGLLGVRIWTMANGEQNYFFMFLARLLSSDENLQPDFSEIEDARFFTRTELEKLGPDETWAGAIAIALKGLDTPQNFWPNSPRLSGDSGVSSSEEWRMWF